MLGLKAEHLTFWKGWKKTNRDRRRTWEMFPPMKREQWRNWGKYNSSWAARSCEQSSSFFGVSFLSQNYTQVRTGSHLGALWSRHSSCGNLVQSPFLSKHDRIVLIECYEWWFGRGGTCHIVFSYSSIVSNYFHQDSCSKSFRLCWVYGFFQKYSTMSLKCQCSGRQ